MARTVRVDYKMGYINNLSCAIRGHDIYKTLWTPIIKEKLSEG